jgi:hypothetical protein
MKRLATIVEQVKGSFATFEVGERVYAEPWPEDDEECFIERVQWEGKTNIMNQMAGVPNEYLKFD